MNNLCADIGWKSINHEGEQLCGDHVDIVEQGEDSTVIVLADGLGSGVKASILSTLTSKIISTLMSEGISLEECVSAIAATLPICSVRGVAYSTFTIIHLINNISAEIIQYDNPPVIMLRDFTRYDYPKQELNIDGKKIYKSVIQLRENDIFIAMSDGCPHAGIGTAFNFGWKVDEIADFMQSVAPVGYTAKTLSTMLVDECNKLYVGNGADEFRNIISLPAEIECRANACVRAAVAHCDKSAISSTFQPKRASLKYERSDVPPIAEIEGVDLVTEGVITINKVIEYAKDALGSNELYEIWGYKRDGASLICRMLFEEATDINFYVGRAVNPAHQNPDLPINFNIKMNLVEELSACLKKMGKRIKVSYF